MISATIIADSANSFGQRITTFKLVFPRIILAEFNTHRMLSKNSASSRAIPFKKMVKQVEENPFIPIRWMKEHKGMQGSEFFSTDDIHGDWIDKTAYLEHQWLSARTFAVKKAKELTAAGLTKQICNRLLEPFLYHTVLCTGTDFENFFALRAHPDAEIHIADLAKKMLAAYNESEPKQLQPGEWHIPFGDKIEDEEQLEEIACSQKADFSFGVDVEDTWNDVLVKIATARCARLSYETLGDEPKIDYAADLRLHDQLINAGHFSPAEHCARAMNDYEMNSYKKTEPSNTGVGYSTIRGWCGNMQGFIQYRKLIAGENKTDSRVKK